MLRSSSIFLLLVALLVSSNFCIRNSHSSHPRWGYKWQSLAKERATSRNHSTSSPTATKYTMDGTANSNGYYMTGKVLKSDGTTLVTWELYIMQEPIFAGRTSDSYSLVTQRPKQGDDFQGSIHDSSQMVVGTFKFSISDDGKINGEYVLDPSNKSYLYRFDVNKSDLKGHYYMVLSSNKYIIGDLEIKKDGEDTYDGQIKNQHGSWVCTKRFSYQSSDGAGVDQFELPNRSQCQRVALLAKMNSSSNMGQQRSGYSKAVKINETDTTWTYGQVIQSLF